MSPAAGAWLNERARRTRHIACALLVITQHLADFANPQGQRAAAQLRAAVALPHQPRRARLRPGHARAARRGPRHDRRPGDPQGRVLQLPSSTPRPTAAPRRGSTSATWSTGPARADPAPRPADPRARARRGRRRRVGGAAPARRPRLAPRPRRRAHPPPSSEAPA